jgi:hypothetical protein
LGFVRSTDDIKALALVRDNLRCLKERGIYAQALLQAWSGTRTNHSRFADGEAEWLFHNADHDKLRAAGDPIPDQPPVVYRGGSGYGRQRRLRGWSWTDSLDVACWFATRIGLASPSILAATVHPNEILACLNHRNEREFIVRPESFSRVPISLGEMHTRAEAYKRSRK